MKIELVRRGGVAFLTVDVPDDASVEQLMNAIHKERKHLAPCRQRITDEKGQKVVVLEREKKLSDYGIKSGDQLFFKDLGTQLPFRFVYIVEYLGPLLIYPLFALRLVHWMYPEPMYPLTVTQKISFFLWMLHYCKRELETLFVHEFGYLTMPVFNVFKNSAYYWGFATLIAWQVNYPAEKKLPSTLFIIGFTTFTVAMLCNFICHMILKQLRTPGRTEWKIPRGFLFEYVTMPNYFCEVMTWVGFAILNGGKLFCVAFVLCGAYQMMQWAKERHSKYLKMFPDYPKSRKRMFPFIW